MPHRAFPVFLMPDFRLHVQEETPKPIVLKKKRRKIFPPYGIDFKNILKKAPVIVHSPNVEVGVGSQKDNVAPGIVEGLIAKQKPVLAV